MTEKINEYPRVHTCLYDWCPARRDECQRCDRIIEIMRKASARAGAKIRALTAEQNGESNG
jgi:hypothetical protein